MNDYKDSTSCVEDSIIGDSVKIYRNCRISRSEIDKYAVIGDSSVVTDSKLGEYVQINRNSMIRNAVIDDYSYGGMNFVAVSAIIRKYCSISWNVSIGGANHDYNKLTTHAFLYDKRFNMIDSPLYDRFADECVIGNDVWIAAGANILRNVKVGDGAVIAAGAVVTKDVLPYSIVAGVPAKMIKMRFDEKIVERLLKIKWWDYPANIIKDNIGLFNSKPTNDILDKMEELYETNRIHIYASRVTSPPPAISMPTTKKNKKVREIMECAYKIPFYKKKFDECALLPKDFNTAADLQKFPITTKAELRDWMNAEIKSHPNQKNWFISKTSGSTGQPLSVIYTTKEYAIQKSIWMQVLRANGYNTLTGKLMGLRGAIRKESNNNDSFIQKLGFFRRKTIHYSKDTESILQELNSYKPDLIYGAPSIFINISQYIVKNKCEYHKPRIIGLISETLDKNTAKQIANFFNCRIFVAYGNEETGNSLYTRWDFPELYHVCNQTHVVNIYDDLGHLADKGRMFITSLYQKEFPIINYDIGDSAEYVVVSGKTFVKNIKGRVDDVLKFKDGCKINFLPLFEIVESAEYMLQVRFIQDSFTKIRILAALKNEYKTKESDAMEDFICKFKGIIKHPEVEIEYELYDALPPDPSGKIRFIVSKV